MRLLLALAALLFAAPADAETALIAVATNFAGAAEQLAADYGAASGDTVTITAGATGKLYAQITAGAPFDAFLSADTKTPAQLEADGPGVAGTRFDYARGRLVLWTADKAADLSDPAAALLAARHVAVANPDLAPYGQAAIEAIAALGLTEIVTPKTVTGENVGQTYAMVASGAADIGFVAASSVAADGGKGAAWTVPEEMHEPITQSAILLAQGAGNQAAQGFLAYLGSDAARPVLKRFGYGTGQ